MKKELLVPFDRNGNLLDYSYWCLTTEQEEICKRDGKFEIFRGDNFLSLFVALCLPFSSSSSVFLNLHPLHSRERRAAHSILLVTL